MKNTIMEYLYRDGSNYKIWTRVVLEGEISQEQKDTIRDCLDCNDSFIPSQVGLPERRFENVNEDDGPWFELYPDTASTETDEEADGLTVDELVARFKECKGSWDATWPQEE